jgi:dolichol-phosphate mannosyltransferase
VGKAFEVVIVDDSSPDNTMEVAKSLQEVFPMIRIVSRKGKLGLGSAYLAGLRVAKGNRIVLMDADLSHHPKFIVPMIELMDGNQNSTVDIVCGTRYKKGGGVAGWYVACLHEMNPVTERVFSQTFRYWFYVTIRDLKRKLTSKGANFLASFLLNPGPSDLTGSFRLYKREALEKILPKVRAKGYAFQMEILVVAKAHGLKFAEVPITFVDRLVLFFSLLLNLCLIAP